MLRHFIGRGMSLSLLCSRGGGGEFIAPPIVPCIAGPCSMRVRTISNVTQLTCCWLLTVEPSLLAFYWGIIRELKLVLLYYCGPLIDQPHQSLCTVLVPVCSVANCVLLVFRREQTSGEEGYSLILLLSFLIIQSTATGTQQEASSCYVEISSKPAPEVAQFTKCHVHRSQWDHSTIHPVHQEWHSPFKFTSGIVQQVHPIIQVSWSPISEATITESPIEWCTLISTESPTSVTIADLHWTLLQLHHSGVNLHSLATILWLCYPTCDRIISIQELLSCDYATRLVIV